MKRGKRKRKPVRNLPASVRARLLEIAKSSHRDFNAVLLQYFQERFLYRLAVSSHREEFILKGALLFLGYGMPGSRPTKDIDFLGMTPSNDPEEVRAAILDIAATEADDGVKFGTKSIVIEPVAEAKEHPGIRARLQGRLGSVRKMLQVDIGFGDEIVPGPVEMNFPTLLDDSPAPRIVAYSWDSVVAEKFEALVRFGYLTSRMKDIFDILFLAEQHPFEFQSLREAIVGTFHNRATPLPDRVHVFSPAFKDLPEKQQQWTAFLERSRLHSHEEFAEAVSWLERFLDPVCEGNSEFPMGAAWDPAEWEWR